MIVRWLLAGVARWFVSEVALRRIATAGLFWIATTSCGSSKDPGSGGAPALSPPANIDATSCASVANGGDVNLCTPCCTQHDHPSATLYEGACVCGKLLYPTDTAVCAGQAATIDTCSTCCGAANFGVTAWVGGTTSACSCSGKSDRTVCASTLTSPNAAGACQVCCLNHGFIRYVYQGVLGAECRCIDM